MVQPNPTSLPVTEPTEEQLSRLREELGALITEARVRGSRCQSRARCWQLIDLGLGSAATVMTAVAGATGLASAAGRVPAAIMALCAAALVAATRFLRSAERSEENWRRRNAWQVLDSDAGLARAGEGHPDAEGLYGALRKLLDRRIVILDMDHAPIPGDALGRQASHSA
jgi:hypothetical protein